MRWRLKKPRQTRKGWGQENRGDRSLTATLNSNNSKNSAGNNGENNDSSITKHDMLDCSKCFVLFLQSSNHPGKQLPPFVILASQVKKLELREMQ